MTRLWRFAVIYVVVSVLAVVYLLVEVFPWRPRSPLGWVLFFVVAAPVVFLGETLGNFLLERNLASRAVERRNTGKSFSWGRIGYLLAALLLGLLAILGVCGATIRVRERDDQGERSDRGEAIMPVLIDAGKGHGCG